MTMTGLLPDTFGISTLDEGGRRFAALVRPDGDVVDVSEHFRDTHAILDAWPGSFETLRQLARTPATHRFERVRALPPLAHPNLLCAGANNKQHVAEMLTKNDFNQHNRRPGETDAQFFARNYAMMEKRAEEGTPFLWAGLHSSLAGADDDVVLSAVGAQHDWELEVAAVLGGTARNASPTRAAELIAGYVMVNDLGTVDLFRRTDIPWGYDWIAKHQPGFKPAGPFIVPAPFVDLSTTRITLRLNGRTMQDWPADDMVFDFPHLIAYASERVRLQAGDLLLAGSPPGNGRQHGQFLTDGDLIESEITGLGRQRNRCVRESADVPPPYYGAWTNAPTVT